MGRKQKVSDDIILNEWRLKMFITRKDFNQRIKEAYQVGLQNGVNRNILSRILNTPVEELLKPSIPKCIKENFKDYV